MPNKLRYKRGDQIMYVPRHALGNMNHPDIEYGFVTSGPTKNGGYFCRFWFKASAGEAFSINELRTKGNSELTPANMLLPSISRPKELVEEMLEKYC